MPYEPREDSFLLKKHIKDFCKLSFSVLDLGTGSGVLAKEAAKYSKDVTASDIDKELIRNLKKQHNQKNVNNINLKKSKTSLQKFDIKKSLISNNINNITFIHSDLFQKIKDKFDLIIFNPPYLSSKPIKTKSVTTKNSRDINKSSNNSNDIINEACKDLALDGGKNGTEIIEKFLKQAKRYLKKDGKVLLLASSLNKNIESLFKKYGCNYRLLDEEKFFFEKLYVWVLNFN